MAEYIGNHSASHIDAIVRSLRETPDKWELFAAGSDSKLRRGTIISLAYTLRHRENGYEIWVANGFWFLSEYRTKRGSGDFPTDVRYSFIGKIKVQLAINHWVRNYWNLLQPSIDRNMIDHKWDKTRF